MTNSAYAKTMEMDFCVVFCDLSMRNPFLAYFVNSDSEKLKVVSSLNSKVVSRHMSSDQSTRGLHLLVLTQCNAELH
jgi:hypothetical protein